MINFKKIYIVFISVGLLLTVSCSNPTAFLTPDEQKDWKDDTNACKKLRTGIIKNYETKLETLKGLNEVEIKKLFGMPDMKDLHKRNEKFYIYYLEPSGACNNSVYGLKKVLSIRFNAVNRVNEIIITNK